MICCQLEAVRPYLVHEKNCMFRHFGVSFRYSNLVVPYIPLPDSTFFAFERLQRFQRNSMNRSTTFPIIPQIRVSTWFLRHIDLKEACAYPGPSFRTTPFHGMPTPTDAYNFRWRTQVPHNFIAMSIHQKSLLISKLALTHCKHSIRPNRHTEVRIVAHDICNDATSMVTIVHSYSS